MSDSKPDVAGHGTKVLSAIISIVMIIWGTAFASAMSEEGFPDLETIDAPASQDN